MRDVLGNTKRQRQKIFSVDCRHVARATKGDTIEPMEVALSESCGGWQRIVNHSWIIFCTGIGEVIRPVDDVAGCRRTAVPQAKDYLAATVHCLRQAASNSGGDDPGGALSRITRNNWKCLG
ncbi:hypothetical protein QQX98_007441 [Neonectria punicea]|uniref:Uncharacterized protein n=1 Tax=Neonectria punicea TaxID=979145 RepID=A0ABR1GYD9_9HYPO